MRKPARRTEDGELMLTEYCISCGEQGRILIRINNDGFHEPTKTHCRINECLNENCFRKLKRNPENWIPDTDGAFEAFKRRSHELAFPDSRQSQFNRRQSFAEVEKNKRSTVDAGGETLRELERVRDSHTYRYRTKNRSVADDSEEHRIDR